MLCTKHVICLPNNERMREGPAECDTTKDHRWYVLWHLQAYTDGIIEPQGWHVSKSVVAA